MTLEIIIKISMDTTLTTDKMDKTLALDKTTTAMTDSSREGTMEIILEDSKMVRTMTPLVQTLVVVTTTAITDSSREVNSLATTTTMTMTASSREGTIEIMTPTLMVATTTAITDSSREEEDNKEATASLSLVTDFQLREFSQARTMGSQTLDRRTSHLLLTLP